MLYYTDVSCVTLAAPSVKQPQTEPVVAAGAWSLFPRPESPPRDSPIARGGEKTQVKGVDGGQQGSMVAIKTRAGEKDSRHACRVYAEKLMLHLAGVPT